MIYDFDLVVILVKVNANDGKAFWQRIMEVEHPLYDWIIRNFLDLNLHSNRHFADWALLIALTAALTLSLVSFVTKGLIQAWLKSDEYVRAQLYYHHKSSWIFRLSAKALHYFYFHF